METEPAVLFSRPPLRLFDDAAEMALGGVPLAANATKSCSPSNNSAV